MPMQPVSSNNIRAIGHDPAAQVLRVEFTSGATYDYENVPAAAHAELVSAPSVGSHFAQHFRNNPAHPATRIA